MEKETADTERAGNVEAPDPIARVWEKTLDEDDEPGLTEIYQRAAWDKHP
jgi:hypothetical protein